RKPTSLMSGSQTLNAWHQATTAIVNSSHSMVVRSFPILRLSAASLHSPVARVFRVPRQRLSLQEAARLCRQFLRVRSQLTVHRDRGLLTEQINRFAGFCFVLAPPPIV